MVSVNHRKHSGTAGCLRVVDQVFLSYDRLAGAMPPEPTVVFQLAVPITLDELRHAIVDRLAAVPELRLIPERRLARRACWIETEIALEDHVEEFQPGMDSPRVAAEKVIAEPLPLNRPLWRIVLIRNQEQSLVVFKVHHALFDGLSQNRVNELLFGNNIVDTARAATTTVTRGWSDVLAVTAKGVPGLLRGLFSPAGRALTTSGMSQRRRLAWTSTELSQLRSLASRHAVTVNDVFLAGLAGALREWPSTPWRGGIRPVWALIPASTHALDEDDYLGNHLVGIRVRLPCSEPDPHRRLRQIAESSAREKRLRLPMLQAGRDHFPAVIVRPIVSFTLSRWFSDVHTSNRGWLGQGTLTVADSPVRRADPVGVQFRHQPFAFSIGTYQDRVVFQVGIDSSLPEPDRFAELWLDQLTALG